MSDAHPDKKGVLQSFQSPCLLPEHTERIYDVWKLKKISLVDIFVAYLISSRHIHFRHYPMPGLAFISSFDRVGKAHSFQHTARTARDPQTRTVGARIWHRL